LLLMDASQDYATVLREMQQFKSRYPTARIALLAEHHERSAEEMLDALRLGAHAYLAKPNRETLIKSLELLLLEETILVPALESSNLIASSAPAAGDHSASAHSLRQRTRRSRLRCRL
jgi:DNA-binding NarL/FixJ family response regulator